MEQLHLFVRQAFPQQLRDLLRFLTVLTITPAQPPSASFRRSSAGSSGSVSVVSCTVLPGASGGMAVCFTSAPSVHVSSG